jgi:hypothetical protein
MARENLIVSAGLPRKPASFAVEPAFPAEKKEATPARAATPTARVRSGLVLRAVARDITIVKGRTHARVR